MNRKVSIGLPQKILMQLLLLSVFFAGMNAIRIASFITIGDLFLFLTGILWLVSIGTRGHPRIPLGIVFSFCLFYLAFSANAILYADSSPTGDLQEYTKFVVSWFLIVYLIADITPSRRYLRYLVGAYVLSASINSVVGIIDLTGIIHIASSINADSLSGEPYPGRARGLTLHPNHLAQTCAISTVFAFASIDRNGYKMATMFSMISLAGVLASGSRGALLGLVIVGILLPILARHQVSRSLKKTFALMTIPLGVMVGLFSYLESFFPESYGAIDRLFTGQGGSAASDKGRIELLQTASQNFGENPIFGAGFYWIGHAHNIIMQVLESAGVVGGLGFTLYLGTLFYMSTRLIPKDTNKLFGLMLVAGAMVFIVSGLFANTVYYRAAVIPFGLLWAYAKVTKGDTVRASRWPRSYAEQVLNSPGTSAPMVRKRHNDTE